MKRIIAFAFVAIAMFACSKQDDASEGMLLNKEGEKTVFYATTEGSTTSGTPGTKVYADENLRVLWNADDRISIFNKSTANAQYAFTGSDGDNSGGFEEVVPIKSRAALDHIYAVYPYSTSNSINNDGTQITLNLPAVQAYRQNSFGVGANTMVAVTDDSFLGFKNVCGFLRFRFYGDNVTVQSIKFEGNNGEKIAGKAYVAPVMGGVPTVSMDATATGSITMNCAEAVTLGTSSTDFTEFIFVIPPTTLSGGFTVTVTDNNGATCVRKYSKSITISRNKIESMSAMKIVPKNYTYTLVTDYSALTVGSEVVVASTAYNVAMGVEMWSYPYRKMSEITKSSDKTTISNPTSDVQVFTLKKGSADNTVMFECKNGSFAGKYIGARIDASPSSNYAQWEYLYNCDATETEKGISFDVHLEENGDALVTPYNTASRYKYLSCSYSNSDFRMYDAYLTNYALAIYKLEGTGEGGDQLIVPVPEFHFTGASYPAGYEGSYYVAGTTTLPKTGGTYEIEYEIKLEGGFVQSDNSKYSYSGWYDWTLDKQVANNKVVVTVPANNTGGARSAYFIMEYSYQVNDVWHNVSVMIYLAQLG